ncbi:distal tail protein Dit [Streptococcus dysgalactiae]|uniref:Phage tail protein n=1 Tax=Streptococcus dysgalactiae subsp. equisimilis TaxID=119602 RepID=A0A9X8XF34_STREQ|nr:distal tail protein Dit [Streptococcus dysgalactiae]SQF66356.1 phage tail protein [Streptococcus dysgalactiae subsp. equisimilis]VEF04334.1 phage tail protein [Streptococcus dysgalactiae subsp. equisimilis]
MYEFNDTIRGTPKETFGIKTTIDGKVLEDELNSDLGTFRTLTVSGRDIVDLEHQSTSVPGRNGEYFHTSTVEVRKLEISAKISGKDNKSIRLQYEKLNSLIVKQKQVFLSFSDEPDRHYLGIFKSKDVPEEVSNEQIIGLTFICYNPFKMSDVKTKKGTSIQNDGLFETKPTITLNLSSPSKEIRLLHVESQKYIRLTGTYTTDEIKIDMATGKITQNGRNILSDLDMVNSRYFELLPGKNTLQCDNATITADFREAYL